VGAAAFGTLITAHYLRKTWYSSTTSNIETNAQHFFIIDKRNRYNRLLDNVFAKEASDRLRDVPFHGNHSPLHIHAFQSSKDINPEATKHLDHDLALDLMSQKNILVSTRIQ
jgi:hypothetical protein